VQDYATRNGFVCQSGNLAKLDDGRQHRRQRELCRLFNSKKQGATGITTVAPYIAGQWGRGNNRLPG
jgi:hypothetical protein